MYSSSGPATTQMPNGYNWFNKSQPYMSEPQTNTVMVVLDSCTTYKFTRSGSSYTPAFGSKAKLSFNSSACEFVFTDCKGVQTKFNNKGKFKGTVDPGGSQVQVQYSPDGAIQSASQQFVQGGQTVTNATSFNYYASGPHAGLLQSVTTTRTASPTVELRRMVYTYYLADEDYGSLGDLKTATEQIPQGTGWVDHEVSYYRYYKDSETNGFEHGLKYSLSPQAFVRLSQDPEVSNPLTASNAKVAAYADHYYEYDSEQRATKSVLQAGLLTYTFSYATSSHSDDYNHWKTKVTMTRPDGSQQITYSNYISQNLLVDLISGSDHWTEYWKYDGQALEIEHAQPSAVASYDDGQADLGVVLRTNAGLINLTEYYSTTTATPTTPGGAAGYVRYTKIKQGSAGTPILQSETTYFEHTGAGATIYPVAASTVFRDEGGTQPITTSFSYTWFSNTTQIQQRTTTLPIVPGTQNGNGASETVTEIYDADGYLIWQRDARGFITYQSYNLPLGALVQQIQDVDGSKLTLPEGWATPPGGGLHLITDYEHDALGRTIQTLGPAHDVNGQSVRTASWTVYKDLADETYSGQGYAVGDGGAYSYTLVNPVSIQQASDDGLRSDAVAAVRGEEVESPGRLAEEDSFPQSTWVRWSVSFANTHEQQTARRTYHLIPASGAGALGTNYDEATYGYDLMNRQNRVVSATGTISRTVYDVRSLAVSSWLGTDDTGATDSNPAGGGASGNNMVQISASQYDGGAAGGDGNLTQETAYVNASTSRVTSFQYDFRNRRTVVDGEIDFYQQTFYDNLNQTIQVDRRDTSSGGNLIGRSETKFDNRGRAYRKIQYAVDPSTGTVGNSLVSNTYYDASGNVIESRPASSEAFTKSTYDGVGRPTAQYVGYTESLSSSSPSSSGGSLLSGDVIFEQQETQYDAASNVLLATSRQRFHNATGTGPLLGPGGSQPKSRDSYVAMWYDGIGRQIASANYGTNDNAGPPTRPDAPPESTDLVLVSQTRYNTQGEAFESVDPAGMVNRTVADAAGRTAQTIQNYVPGDADGCVCEANDQNVTTEMRYGPGGQLVQLIAKNPATGDQVTEYVYGVTLADSDLASNDLLQAEIYPDSEDADDRVTYRYNRQGQRIRLQDQNGSVHEYDYDLLGRQTADKVTTVGEGVNNEILRIGQSYEVRGLVEKLTSYTTVAGTTAANEVQNVYNSFSQLTHQYQDHQGTINTSTTPKVQYGYADGSANTIRPTSMTYPDGRVLEYLYDDIHADKLSRIRTLRWDGVNVCRYSYLGISTFVATDYLEPQVKLDYALGSGANPYTGFDRFGRIVDLLWEKYGASSSSSSSSGPGNQVVHLQYDYDQASNRTHRADLVAQAYNKGFDELYEYDGLHRLKKFHRGRLVENNTVIESPTLQQGWHLDATGNWQNFTQSDQADASQTLDQQRVANHVNEITQIARTVGANWATPEYDRNGNMIVIPQPKDMTKTFKGTWDAWNRLIKLEEPDGLGGWQTLAEYAYDAQIWRILKKTYKSSVLDETRHFYFTSLWQNIEERLGTTPNSASAQQQYVWGLRYVDELINRSSSSRIYSCAADTWKVVATVFANGEFANRFAYLPYGRHLTLSSNFQNADDPSWNVLFNGLFLDVSSFLYQARFRLSPPSLGPWISRDRVGYRDGYNLYREYFVPNGSDPLGTWVWPWDPNADWNPQATAQVWIGGLQQAWGTVCSVANWKLFNNDLVNCVCGIAGVADLFSGNIIIDKSDCVCNILTNLQLACNGRQWAAGFYLPITALDCFSAELGAAAGCEVGASIGGSLGGALTAIVGGEGAVPGALIGCLVGSKFGDALIDTSMFVLQNIIVQGTVLPMSQMKSCCNVTSAIWSAAVGGGQQGGMIASKQKVRCACKSILAKATR